MAEPKRGQQTILGATILVSLLVVISKVLGFAREAIIAAYFGATEETDAFFLAYNMPSMLFPAVCNSLSIAFTAIFVRKLTESEIGGDQYGSRMINSTFIIGLILSIVGVVASPIIVPIFAPGFSGNQLALSIKLTRLTMGAFSLTMLTYMLTAVLNSKKFFVGAQVAGVLHNVVLILILLLLGKHQSMEVLTLTFIVGLIVQVFVLAYCTRNRFRFTADFRHGYKETKELLLLAAPILLGNCISQINSIVDKMLSSTLESGSVSALSYATTLYTVVVSVFIMSLSSVLYPSLIDNIANENEEQFSNNLINSVLGLSTLLLFISVITVFDAQKIVQIVFGRGSFNQNAVFLTSGALAFYGPCFAFYGFREALSKAFYAVKNTRTPMINSAIGVAVNIICSLILVNYMGLSGIALGTTISSIVTSGLLVVSIKKEMPFVRISACLIPLLKQLMASILVYFALVMSSFIIVIDSSIILFVLHTIVGGVLYFVILFILREKYTIFAIKKMALFLSRKLSI